MKKTDGFLSKSEDALGNRMKQYEGMEADRRVMPRLPVLARLDGRAFHSFTRKATRPFDAGFSHAMQATAKYLVEETNARIGYVQSDEISLVFYTDDPKSEIFFAGRLQKMNSTLAAIASVHFNRVGPTLAPDLPWETMPTFDARVWAVPTKDEAVNTLIWRQADAVRNSILAVAQAHFSHRELHGVTAQQAQEKLHQERGVNWNDYPWTLKRGTFFQRKAVERRFGEMRPEERDALPPRHAARTNPDLVVRRSSVLPVDLWLTKVTNRVSVVFDGAEPVYAADAVLP